MRSLFHWDQRNYPNQRNLPRLSCSENVRDEMRPALWSVETTPWGLALWSAKTTPWGAISLGPNKPK